MTGTGGRASWLAPCLSCLLAACSYDTSDAGPRAAAAVAAIAVESARYRELRDTLPLSLEYQLPAHAPVGQPFTFDIELRTPLPRGVLEIDIGPLAGATLLGESRRRIDLGRASRPPRLTLQLVPSAAQPSRSLTLAVALQGGAGVQRSWQIDLPPE